MSSDILELALTKAKIRNKMLLRLKEQKEENRAKKSKKIREKLFRSRVFRKAKTIMFYMSFGGEVDTREMIMETQKLGKTVVVPVCGKNRMLRPCILKEKATLLKGPYGVSEPAIRKSVDLKNLSLVLVPGLAFDIKGRRLGRGKGYYDRFLNILPEKATSVGLAFDFQILPRVPTNNKDIDVKKVIFA